MGNYQKKMEYLKQVCDALNKANIRQFLYRGNDGQPVYNDWIPSGDVFFGIISDIKAYNYLKANNLINTGICPECGEFPIDSKYSFTSGFNANVTYHLCKNCYSAGNKSSVNPANSEKGCYIATACYGNINAPEVYFFRQYRDNILKKSFLGNLSVSLYYFFSPFIARVLTNRTSLNGWVRMNILDRIYRYLKTKNRMLK